MDRSPSDLSTRFGRRVRQRRVLLGLTQADVAALIGMGRGQYTRLEHGEYRKVQLIQLVALADVLGVTVDFLLARTDEAPPILPPLACPGERPCLESVSSLPTTIPPEGATVDGEYNMP